MTDNNLKELDLSQRIVEALLRSSEPRPPANRQFRPGKDTVIGEVPEHLRHIHNLLEELYNEVLEANQRYHALQTTFFKVLEQHVSRGDFNGVMVCADWQVTGHN